MKKILYILFSTLIVIPALAEDIGSSKITVSFVDNNENPIKNTTVILDEKEYRTNRNGAITLDNTPENKDSIEIKIDGFETNTISQNISQDTPLTITMTRCTSSTSEKTEEKTECKCTSNDKNADTNDNNYEWNDKGKLICKIKKCKSDRYKLNSEKNRCEDQVGKSCEPKDNNATKAKYKWENDKLVCEIKKCTDSYIPNDDGSACIKSDGPCSDEQTKEIENATAGELKNGVCYATECKAGYEVSKGGCIKISGNCDPMPDNATKAHREYKEDTKQEVCIIDECSDGYTTSPDKLSCIEPILSEEDSNKKIEELQENADAMKEKEQSDANKLLGAASIGAMGIGGMQALSALSEQRADEDAELDMSAYLATFRCDFGQGRNIQGGQTGIVLPGGNQLFSLYNEYKTLAADLKTRKEALGLTPGIESETILDKANTGLYDDIGSGRSDGAYTSLATALSNPNSADAAEWAAQREDTATQLQRGLITVGVGAAASIIGNLAINENKKAAQESSDEIIAKFEPLKTLENDIKALPNQEANAKCPEDATGNYPDCDCKEQKKAYNNNTNTCETCPGNKIGKGSKCECPDGTVPGDNDTCQEAKTPIDPQCDIYDSNIKVNINTGKCSCVNGYIPTADGKNCECPSATHKINNGLCIKKAEPTPVTQTVVTKKTVLPAKNLFALGSYDLTRQALLTIGEFAGNVKTQMGTDTNYCITVVGHTDETGTNAINEPLSKNRANAVKKALTDADLSGTNIQTSGIASTECTSEFRQNADGCKANNKNCEACRKVEITFSTTSCSNS